VAFGFDKGPDFLDFAGLAGEEGTAHDAHECTAHELLFLPGAELFDGFVARVAEQGEIEILLCLERSKSFDGIGAHSEEGDAELVEFFFCVAKLGRFYRSTGSVGFGKEKEKDPLAREVFERDVFAFIGFETEGGGLGTYFEHSISSF